MLVSASKIWSKQIRKHKMISFQNYSLIVHAANTSDSDKGLVNWNSYF